MTAEMKQILAVASGSYCIPIFFNPALFFFIVGAWARKCVNNNEEEIENVNEAPAV